MEREALVNKLQELSLLKVFFRKEVEYDLADTVELTEDELKNAIKAFYVNNSLESNEQVQEFIRVNGITESALMAQATKEARLNKLSLQMYSSQAAETFANRKTALDKVTYGLIRIKDENMIREVYCKLEAGEEDFWELALRFGEGPERHTMGVVGPASLRQGHPVLNRLLQTLQEGAMSQPVRLGETWALVRKISYLPAKLTVNVTNKLCIALLEQEIESRTMARIAELNIAGRSHS